MSELMIMSKDEIDVMTESIVDRVTDRLQQVLNQSAAERAVGREEMARLLGVGLASVDRSVRDGSIPSMLIHSRRIFLPSRVFAVLENRASQAPDKVS